MWRWADLDLEPHVPGRQRAGDRDLRDHPSSDGRSSRLHGTSCCRRSFAVVCSCSWRGGREAKEVDVGVGNRMGSPKLDKPEGRTYWRALCTSSSARQQKTGVQEGHQRSQSWKGGSGL